jgi:hypothetical protein
MMTENALPPAVQVITAALLSDVEYRRTWSANIAMAFKDEVSRRNPDCATYVLDREEIHEIANAAAENFLDVLCLLSND